jgi:hypothetical protein
MASELVALRYAILVIFHSAKRNGDFTLGGLLSLLDEDVQKDEFSPAGAEVKHPERFALMPKTKLPDFAGDVLYVWLSQCKAQCLEELSLFDKPCAYARTSSNEKLNDR